MKRYLVLGGLCMAIGCAPSDSGDPAPSDNSTSQVETVEPARDVAAKTIETTDDVATATKNVGIEVERAGHKAALRN